MEHQPTDGTGPFKVKGTDYRNMNTQLFYTLDI